MKTSSKGIEFIKRHEGFRARAYKCPAGVWTIGYGHTRGVNHGDVITKEQGERFLIQDLQTAEREVNSHGLIINQNQFDALVSFVFNIGVGNFSRSTLLRKLKVNTNDSTISYEFSRWKNGGGKVLPGLVKRRKEESELYFKRV